METALIREEVVSVVEMVFVLEPPLPLPLCVVSDHTDHRSVSDEAGDAFLVWCIPASKATAHATVLGEE